MLRAVDLWANWSSEQVGGFPRFNSSSQWQGSYPGTSSRSFQIFSIFSFPLWKAGSCWRWLYHVSGYAFLSHLLCTSDKQVMTPDGI